MPYFKRTPYEDMIGSRTSSVDVPSSLTSEQPATSLDKASAVFARESDILTDAHIPSSLPGSEKPEHWKTDSFSPQSNVSQLSVPLLEPQTVRAGGVATLVLSLENVDKQNWSQCRLSAGEMLGSQNHRLPTTCIELSPDTINVPPSGSSEVRVSVRIPSDTMPGVYAGLIQTIEPEPERVVLKIRVET